MPENLFRILVGAIAVNAGNVLVLQRSLREKFMPGAWGLPCGKIGFGEDLEVAVRRELLEEAGVHGRVVRIVGYSTFMSTKDGVSLHNLQVNFLLDVEEAQITLDHSNDDYKWMPLSSADSSGLDDFTVATIKQATE